MFLGVDAHGLVKDQGFPGVLRNIAEIDPGKVDAGLIQGVNILNFTADNKNTLIGIISVFDIARSFFRS